tara:strand:+ start:288 stop:494 length:207 start_codon:yes stop_codon:yes gene_type:complete
MTKKIRLTDDEPATTQTPDQNDSAIVSDDIVVRQLMKYLEAIDWKLWEMLKLMKADRDDAEAENETDK